MSKSDLFVFKYKYYNKNILFVKQNNIIMNNINYYLYNRLFV